jgi:hypothetical protein
MAESRASLAESRASLVESVISRPESVVSVIEQKMPYKRTEVVITTPPPPPVEQVFEQVETCLNLPPKRPPRSPSPNKMRRLSDVPKPVTPQPLQPQQPQTPTQGNLSRCIVNCSSVAQSDVRRTWTTFFLGTHFLYFNLELDLHNNFGPFCLLYKLCVTEKRTYTHYVL